MQIINGIIGVIALLASVFFIFMSAMFYREHSSFSDAPWITALLCTIGVGIAAGLYLYGIWMLGLHWWPL